MKNGRFVSGLILGILGFALIILSIIFALFLLIYGIPLFVIGLVIILNKNEDKIEARKDIKMGGSKK